MTIRQWVCISMSAYSRVLLAVLVLASAASRKTALESPFKPAQGWILVKNGSLSDIGTAIRDYDGIAIEQRLGVFRVELHPQTDGSVAVVLPDGFPAYHLANMTGWLSAPPDLESVHGAHSWITAPGDGFKYYLEPETSNAWGDTLIGTSTLGQSIRVFLPEPGMSEDSKSEPTGKSRRSRFRRGRSLWSSRLIQTPLSATHDSMPTARWTMFGTGSTRHSFGPKTLHCSAQSGVRPS